MPGATAIFITHGHGDHAGDALALTRETGAPLVGVFDLMEHWERAESVDTAKFHRGGTVKLGNVAVTLVNAVHSSTLDGPDGFKVAGSEAGFMIEGDGHTIYVSGDTDVMADMAVFEALHQPDIGILCVGGHFTMDQHRAAYAAKTFFDFKTIVPCHYKTFPVLAQDVEELKAALPDIEVLQLDVMRAHEIA